MVEHKPQPPPLPANDRRRDERLEILAQIDLRRGDDADVHILEAANISAGGLFVRVDHGFDVPMAVGDQVQVYLNLNGDGSDHELELSCDAEVVRHAADGFGLRWLAPDAEITRRLTAIIDHVREHG